MNIGQSVIDIGYDKFYHSHEYSCSIWQLIRDLKRAQCPPEIIEQLNEWAYKPYPTLVDLTRAEEGRGTPS